MVGTYKKYRASIEQKNNKIDRYITNRTTAFKDWSTLILAVGTN